MKGSRLSRYVSLDLGSSSISWCDLATDEVISEPNLIVVDQKRWKVMDVGSSAANMEGHAEGNLIVMRPIRGGRLDDVRLAERYFRAVIKRMASSRRGRPNIALATPSFLTTAEKRVMASALSKAGAASVIFVDATVAAAVGAGADIQGPDGVMVASIGAQTTFAGILALGDSIEMQNGFVGGESLNEAISRYLRDAYQLIMLESDIEELKIALVDLTDGATSVAATLKGRHVETGADHTVEVDSAELTSSVRSAVGSICDVVLNTLKQAPAEISHDLSTQGLHLVGRASLLRGLDELIESLIQIPAHHPPVVERAVVLGAAKILGQVRS